MHSLKSIYISTEQQCMLFDSMVGTVLSYASEIWGCHRAHDIGVIHKHYNVMAMAFNTTSNNILDMSRRSVLFLVPRVPGENHRPAASE
jgi:hypothetical protein